MIEALGAISVAWLLIGVAAFLFSVVHNLHHAGQHKCRVHDHTFALMVWWYVAGISVTATLAIKTIVGWF